MNNEKRFGRQTPTIWHTLPYTKTYGSDALACYEKSGREAIEWQKGLIYDILAVDDDGLFVHSRFGYSVPRQNGKNEVIAIRELWGLQNGERILHTAHRTSTSRQAWERLVFLLEASGIHEIKGDVKEGFTSGKSKGQEFIFLSEKYGGGRIQFRTRTTTGGLGETFDLLVIDEAQEYQDDQESALKYTIATSENPQTIYLGTPPTPYSSGTLFPKFRKDTLTGKKRHAGWAEWSVGHEMDINNVDAWYETNPSLGYKLRERTIEDELGEGKESAVDFNIQRLGLWITYNQKSAISKTEWRELEVETLPKLSGKMALGIKFNVDGSTCALSVAVKTKDDKIFFECVNCRTMRDGVEWLVDFAYRSRANVSKIVIDGKNGAEILKERLTEINIKNFVVVTSTEYIEANSKFEQAFFAKTLVHMSQAGAEKIATNCERRNVGAGGGWAYRSIKAGADISILDSIILACWGCSTFKEKKKQKASY